MNILNQTAHYMFGVTNMQSAIERMTEPVSYKVVQKPGQAELIGYYPGIFDRVRNASGEMTIMTAKLTVNGVYMTGGLIAALEGVGAMSPNGMLSAAGVARNFFNGTNTVVANGIYYTGSSICLGLQYLVRPVVEHVIAPAAGIVLDAALHHPVNATIGVAVPLLVYSGMNDLAAATALPAQQVHVRGSSVGIKEVPVRPLAERATQAAIGFGKLTTALGLTAIGVHINS